MIKKRRIIGLLLALSLIINLIIPTVGTSAAGARAIKANSKLDGVTYTMQPDVITMPEGTTYELEEEEALTNPKEPDTNSIKSMAVKYRKGSSTLEGDTRRTKLIIPSGGEAVNSLDEEPRWNISKKYLPKSMIVNSETRRTLSPEIGKVYYDKANRSVMKVTGDPTTDASGMTTIPVEQPEINELIENLSIPEQTIPLSNDDIGYVNEEVRMVTDIYSRGTGSIESYSTSSRKPMVEIDLSGLDLINESSENDSKKALDDKLKAIDNDSSLTAYEKSAAKDKAKKEAEELENQADSKLKYKAKVEITEGTLKVYEPTLTAYASWGSWGEFEAEAIANIDVETDLLIDGDLNISKQVEILIYGYEIDFEIGKFYAGVYLVVGLNGQIDFQIRVQQEGTVKVGAKAVGWLIPMAAYPIVEYDNKKFETAITVSGELKLWAHAMPRAGIELFGVEVISAYFKVGLEATVSFDITSEAQSVRLWVDVILQLKAVIFDNNIDILDKRYNIYDRTWAHTEGKRIDGATDIDVTPAFAYLNIDKVDAYRDIIRGTVFRSKEKDADLIPCTEDPVKIIITHADGKSSITEVTADSDGSFVLEMPISPLDRVAAKYLRTETQYKYEATIPSTNVPLPYAITYLYPDAFNSKITGEINGEKYGPDEIANNGDEVKFTKPIDIIVEKADSSKKTYKVTPKKNGEFTLENIELYQDDKVSSQLVFEDAQVVSEAKKPELGLEMYLDVKNDKKNKTISISGSIQNMHGSEPYLGNVALISHGPTKDKVVKARDISEGLGLSQISQKREITRRDKSSTGLMLDRFKPITKSASNTISIDAYQDFLGAFKDPLSRSIKAPTKEIDYTYSSPSSVFEFKDIEYLEFMGVSIMIEYNGVKLIKEIIPASQLPQPPSLERAVVSPVKAYIEKRINTAFDRDMNTAISKQKTALQKAMQNENTNIDFSQNNGVAYTMSMMPSPPSNEPKDYSFIEGDLKLVAKAGAGNITLTWNKLKDEANVKGYNVYRGTKTDGESLKAINSKLLISPKYVDKSVKAKTKYYYLCSVVFENGDEFIISNEASATPRISKRQ